MSDITFISVLDNESCPEVPPFLQGAKSSEHNRMLFNREAGYLGYPIEWTGDKEGGQANIPDIPLGEIRVNEGSEFVVTPEIVCEIRKLIEYKRLRANEVAREIMNIYPPHTFSETVRAMANPAENRWLEFIADGVQEPSNSIYGQQYSSNYKQLKAWMGDYGDADSRHHFDRMEVTYFSNLSGSATQMLIEEFAFEKDEEGNPKGSPLDYASFFPWCPDKPAYNAMLPEGMRPAEVIPVEKPVDLDLEFIREQYSAHDPILLPWTVVEEASPAELEQYSEEYYLGPGAVTQTIELETEFDGPVKWLVQGREDKWYVVTNMAFHPEYRDYFVALSQALRDAAALGPIVEGDETYDLHPEFREYTLNVANWLEQGKFLKILEADLNQHEGNLFFTAFPHESYWDDGVKYPFMAEIGIRDSASGLMSEKEASAFQDLENKAVQVAGEKGFSYQGKEIDPAEISKGSVLVWIYRNGGFIRGFFREPAGHDYPKRDFLGIDKHRTVVILDALEAAEDVFGAYAEQIVDPEGETEMTFDIIKDFALWHEGTHGTGARPETPTDSGRTMAEVYGGYWGYIAEPLADAGAFLSIDYRHQKDVFDDQHRTDLINSALTWQAKRYYPKAVVKHCIENVNPDASHVVGVSMLLGWLFNSESIMLSSDGQSLVFDKRAVMSSLHGFFDTLTEYSFRDDLEGFKAFATQCVDGIPDAFEKRVLGLKATLPDLYIVNRNPDPAALWEVVK